MKYRVRLLLAALTAVAMSVFMMMTVAPQKASASQPPDGGPSNTIPSAVPSTATPQVNNGDVQSLAQVGNLIVIGGNFTTVNNQTYNHVAAFNSSTGALATSFNPSVNGIVNAVAPGPNNHTVYVGGNFTQIGSTNVTDLALLDLNTGAIVAGWTSPSFDFGEVRDLALRGSHLYVGGTFGRVGGKAHAGLAALDPNTGAVQSFMNVQLSGQHNPQTTGWVGTRRFDVTANGATMVVIGNFAQADGLPRMQIAKINLTGASATVDPTWNTTRYQPTCYSWAFSDTVRGISFSPDGSYFVVTSTGGGNPGTLCDAAAKFDTNAQGADVQPEWISETGGDSLQGVTVTDSAIFMGGHNRWNNDPLGVDSPGAGAVPRAGLSALDPASGRPLDWNPGRVPLGSWVYNFLATPQGIYLGSDTDYIGSHYQYKRAKVAFFPYAGGRQLASTATGTLPGSVFMAGKQANAGTSNVLYRVNAGGAAVQATDNGPDWSADTDATSPYRNSGSNAAGWSPGATVDSTVPATTPPSIFDSERWDPTGDPEMQWSFPVTAGTPIEVRLYLANRCTCTSGVGQRVFNVSLDGQPWLTNEDLVADVGDQTGTMKAKDITAPSNGQVTISFGHVTENPLVNGIEIVRTDQQAPPAGDVNGVSRVNFTGTTASDPVAVDNGGISWGDARGAFMVGNKVFYGSTDGFLHSRTYDGATWGSDVKYDPYHDPEWENVRTGVGTTTFGGTFPSLYGELPNVTGMFYSGGRLYYTEFGNSNLQWRWFSPDSGIVDETHATVPSSISFSDADGMFVSGGKLYYVTKSDGVLHSIDFTASGVTGQPVTVSGPAVDGVDWRNRALFLFNGKPVGGINTPPTAAFSSSCQDNGCAFNASGSNDPDGSIASYAWNFGDGKTATGATPSHSYTDGGTYTVSLTVTDNDGATATVTHDVTVTAPAANTLAYVASAHSDTGAALYKQLTVPATASTGDTMVLTFTDGSTTSSSGPSGVTGWTQLDTYTNGSIKSTVWTKTVAAGDPGATVRFDYTVYEKAMLSLSVYSGVDGSQLNTAAVAHSGDSNTATHTTPTITANVGDWVLSYWVDKSAGTNAWTGPAGVKQRDTATGVGSGRYGMLSDDSGGPVAAGSYGGLTATTDAVSSKAIMWTIRLASAG